MGSKITVSLFPATLPKRGSGYDLAIAIAIMTANGDLPTPPDGAMFLSELGLDGRLRPVPGVLPAALAAAEAGIATIVVAAANQAEAALVPDMTVIAAGSLAEVAARLAGTPWRLNAEVPGTVLRRCLPPAAGALKPLERAMELGQVSARGADRIVRVAWTLADLAAGDQPGRAEINLAIGLRLGTTGDRFRLAGTISASGGASCRRSPLPLPRERGGHRGAR